MLNPVLTWLYMLEWGGGGGGGPQYPYRAPTVTLSGLVFLLTYGNPLTPVLEDFRHFTPNQHFHLYTGHQVWCVVF